MAENPPFLYNPGKCAALRACLSAERFDRYLVERGGNEVEALQLYTHNTALSAAFYGPLQACEVALRNASNDAIAFYRGHEWYLDGSLLAPSDVAMAQEAIERATRLGKGVTPGRVVSELSFAFWTGLYTKGYEHALWRTMLVAKFSPRPKRFDLYDDLKKLRALRNRIAHHEPIYDFDLMADMERITRVLGLISPPLADWVNEHQRVYDAIALAPAEVCRF